MVADMTREIVPGMAKAIRDRMTELRLSPGDLIRATTASGPGLAPIRKGERRAYQDRLKFDLCDALGWTPDSIDRLMRGEPAVIADPANPVMTLEALAAEVRSLARVVRELSAQVDQVAAQPGGSESAGRSA